MKRLQFSSLIWKEMHECRKTRKICLQKEKKEYCFKNILSNPLVEALYSIQPSLIDANNAIEILAQGILSFGNAVLFY